MISNRETIQGFEERLKYSKESGAPEQEINFLTNIIIEMKWSCLHPKCNERLGRHITHISSLDGYDRYCVDCFYDLGLHIGDEYYLCETLEMEKRRKGASFLPQSYYEPARK